MQPEQLASYRPLILTIAGFVGLIIIAAAAFYLGTLNASPSVTLCTNTRDLAASVSSTTATGSGQQPLVAQQEIYSDPVADSQLSACINDPSKGGTGDQGVDSCYTAALSAYRSDEKSALDNLSQAVQSINSNNDADAVQYVTEAKKSFTAQEQSWKSYMDSICTLASDFATTGTIGPGWEMQCEIAATRRHIQDMNDVAQNSLP